MGPVKTFNIGGEYKPSSTSMYQFAEIVFLDKPSEDSPYFLYQILNYNLSDDQVTLELPSFLSRTENVLLLGKIKSIDRQKKSVILTNGNVVGYMYLIMAAGKKMMCAVTDNPIDTGLQILMGALRIKPKIPDSFYMPPDRYAEQVQSKNHINLAPETHQACLVALVQYLILNASKPANDSSIPRQKRLYEVQL